MENREEQSFCVLTIGECREILDELNGMFEFYSQAVLATNPQIKGFLFCKNRIHEILSKSVLVKDVAPGLIVVGGKP